MNGMTNATTVAGRDDVRQSYLIHNLLFRPGLGLVGSANWALGLGILQRTSKMQMRIPGLERDVQPFPWSRGVVDLKAMVRNGLCEDRITPMHKN